MGVDWFRMRPRPGPGPAALAGLVRQQAADFAASGSLYDDFDHLPVAANPGSPGTSADNRADRALYAQVEIDTGPDCYIRVSGFTLNPLFPAEWRLAAYRSYLPDELPGHWQRWESHLDQVRRGGHRGYLYAWYCYTTSRKLGQEWQALRDRADAARSRSNAWATRPALIDVREQILARPLPATSPAPRWDTNHRDTNHRDTNHRDTNHRDTNPPPATPPGDDGASRLALAREWNRRVPAGQKSRISRVPAFDEFLANALDNPWFAASLAWLRQAAEERYGLLLDF